MIIPDFLSRDNYLHMPIMRRFLKEHNLAVSGNYADYIKEIENYANKNSANEEEVRSWLCKIAAEGSKEVCFKKIRSIQTWHTDETMLRVKFEELFPSCPMTDITRYYNTGERNMINYHIDADENGIVHRVHLIFSQLFLYGDVGKQGNYTPYPVFVTIYLDEGFIVCLSKAKSTLFQYDQNNQFLISEARINTIEYGNEIIDDLADKLGFETEKDKRIVSHEVASMLYKLYEKYSFTPEAVKNEVASQQQLINSFIDEIFKQLSLDPRNKPLARMDAEILVEKFISINGNNEEIFTQDRPAYLYKVSTDDEQQMTKIDTMSYKTVPLQCTEAFFDSKKAVLKGKKCKRLNLVFKRINDKYFPKSNQLTAQFGTHKTYGYVKMTQYAEEADIQNVLQAVFENY